jgi:hypothetical protein
LRRAIVVILGIILALAIVAPVASAQGSSETSGQVNTGQVQKLGAAWWQWALKNPTATNPTVGSYSDTSTEGSAKCDGLVKNGASGNVFFLAGSSDFSGTPVERSCTVPTGSKLVFPVVDFVCGPLFHDPGTTEAALSAECKQILDYAVKGATDVHATVDGKDVTSRMVCTTSSKFEATVPADNPFGADAGTDIAVGSGCWVLLKPLPPGEHTITFGGTFPLDPTVFGAGAPDLTQDVTYNLTVAPHNNR